MFNYTQIVCVCVCVEIFYFLFLKCSRMLQNEIKKLLVGDKYARNVQQ
jgi:hypothetical protein